MRNVEETGMEIADKPPRGMLCRSASVRHKACSRIVLGWLFLFVPIFAVGAWARDVPFKPLRSSGISFPIGYQDTLHYLTPTLPEFARKSPLEIPFLDALERAWRETRSREILEPKSRSLADFSQIDIPINLPNPIEKVIGQGANLRVTGSEQITFGGQTRYRLNEPLTEYGRRSRFPTLDMKQHLKINLEGTVGQKIHVTVHHDSDIETPLENRIKLRYEGDDDEIVQKIEMGNTNLTIPGSQFVSYSGKQEGLFGAKMLAKLGPLDITAIASKQEGRTAAATFRPNVRDSVVLDDIDFVRNKYFFLMDPYDVDPSKTFSEVELYIDDGIGTNNDAAVHAFAFLDPDASRYPDPAAWDTVSSAFEGNFDVLEPNKDYAFDPRTGEISLQRTLQSSQTLAVRYIYGDGVEADTIGGSVGGTLMLKMIRPNDEVLTNRWGVWGGTLNYERKNVYSIGVNYIVEDKVQVKIYRKASPVDEDIQKTYEYSKILGIDLVDENGVRAGPQNNWKTDGYADGGRINGEAGLLLFPDLRPFDPDVRFMDERPETLLAENRNPDIYDRPPVDLKRKEEFSKFYIVVRFTTPQTTFKMKHMNILENSEVVTLNGRRLTRNVDYEIYYETGQIRFLTEEALDPNAHITVDYQYVPFLSLAQQSLVGLHGIYKLSDHSNISTAWIYQSKKSPEERPRLGQEPSRIVLGDIRAQLEFKPDIMTSIVDALPFVEATNPSRLTFSGEIAMSLPNPNTKGNVYIDDMEGVRDLRSFSIMREAWVPASPPFGYKWENTRKIWWYVRDNEVDEKDLFPNAESRPGEAKIPVMEINFKGQKYRSIYDPDSSWSGLMRLVSKTGSDYSELKFFEVWLKPKVGSGGRMNIDLGSVSENYYHPWVDSLDTEDRDNNGVRSADENTGLDGVFTGTPGDDPDDDWSYSEGDYSHINGTENDPRISADTEDLDLDGNLDVNEVLFRLSFDLDDTTYIVNETPEGWRQYRIPLSQADTLGGSPNWRSIKYIRFFFTGIDSPAIYQIAYLQLAGASWLEEGIRQKQTMTPTDVNPDEVFEISAKNTRDDPDYIPPYDPGKDPQGYKKREQSFVFSLRNLSPGNSGSVYKAVPGEPQDYTLYESMAFYVHGPQEVTQESLYIFVRFGTDSLNFYEYGTRIEPGWQDVRIPLGDLTNLKTAPPDTISIYGKDGIEYRYRAIPSGWLAAYGSPNITRVSRIGAGVVNLGSRKTSSKALEVWFDDLRLTNVRRQAGFAKRLSVGASFSDVVKIDFDFRQTDTEFQTLSAKRRGSDDTDYSISFTTSIERFLPFSSLTLPFSARFHRATSLPTLASKSDILLREDQRKEQEKTSADESYRLSFSKQKKSSNWFMRLTFDGLSGNASYTRNRGSSPELADTSSGYTGSLNYKFTPWWNHSLRFFRGYAISYLPENLSATITGQTRSIKRINKRQGVVTEDRYTREVKGVFNISFKPVSGPSFQTDYSLKMTRDLDLNKKVPLIRSLGKGRELSRNQRASLKYSPSFGKWLRPTLSYDVNYEENADPKLRAQTDPPGVRRVSVSGRSRVDVILSPGSAFISRDHGPDTSGVSFIQKLVSKIPDVDIRYVLDRNAKYNKVIGRPSLKFQLGIDPEDVSQIVVLGSSGAAQRTDQQTRKTGFDISTDFRPIAWLSMETKYKFDRSQRTYGGAKTFTEQSVWPDITGSVSSLANLNPFSNWWKNSSISMGYKGSRNVEGRGVSVKTKETNKHEWLPLLGWDATWQNGVRTTLNVRRSTSEAENLSGTRTLKRTQTSSINFQIRHSFSAPQGISIPLAGRPLKFKSNLTLSVDFTYEASKTTTPTAGNRVDRDTRKFSFITTASYSFSKKVTGSANAKFIQESDKVRGETFRTIGLSASVLIRF